MDLHNLATEFPEYKDAIHILKTKDAHFRTIFERFQEIDKAVVRSQQRIDLVSAEEEAILRKTRLQLKEQIVDMLKHFSDTAKS